MPNASVRRHLLKFARFYDAAAVLREAAHLGQGLVLADNEEIGEKLAMELLFEWIVV
jgi:hypothetical protein